MTERTTVLTRSECIKLLQKKIQDVKHEYIQGAEAQRNHNKAILSEVVPADRGGGALIDFL